MVENLNLLIILPDSYLMTVLNYGTSRKSNKIRNINSELNRNRNGTWSKRNKNSRTNKITKMLRTEHEQERNRNKN